MTTHELYMQRAQHIIQAHSDSVATQCRQLAESMGLEAEITVNISCEHQTAPANPVAKSFAELFGALTH